MANSRPVVIAGNWKMYKTIEEAVAYVQALGPLVKEAKAEVYLSVPFTAIHPAAEAAQGTKIVIGAQNMNDASEGAFTGEVSARMLKDAGAKFVILGHSERRHYFGETNDFIHKKVKRALQEGLQPILCIGETHQERDEGQTEKVIQEQLSQCLADLTAEQAATVIIAYEPVWAIGNGHAANPETAEEVQKLCRKLIDDQWSGVGNKVVILYGGSVKPDNAKSFVDQPDVDGLLVGGASLSPEIFSKIVNYNEVLVK